MAKLISMKNGCSGDRATTYLGYAPNTFTVVADSGEVIGYVDQMKDPKYNRRTTCWAGSAGVFDLYAQSLADMRKLVADL